MDRRRFITDTAGALALVEAFALVECLRHVGHVQYVAIAGALIAPLVAIAAQKVTIRGAAEGGWLFVLLFFGELYLLAFGLGDFTWADIHTAAISRFDYAYPILSMDGERFRDVYLVLASAAFTLFALFFIAVRKIDAMAATRLVALSAGFGAVFLLSVSAMLLRDEGWWRLSMMTLLNGTALIPLAKQPTPYVINFIKDSLIVGQYWDSWLRMRTGWALLGLIGLAIMPVFPVAGELLFILNLLYNLWISAHAATFLFVSTETPNPKRRDELLRQLYAIRPTNPLTQLFKSMEPYRGPSRPLGAVPFFFGNPQPQPPAQPEAQTQQQEVPRG